MLYTKLFQPTLSLTLLFIALSCNSSRQSASYKAQLNATYIHQFKLTYFKQLLAKSYNNSPAVKEIINTDHSGFTEPILAPEDFTFIDSLTTIDNQRLVTDSISGKRRAEGAQGKRPLGFIMDQLNSKWLDSIAKRRLKMLVTHGSKQD